MSIENKDIQISVIIPAYNAEQFILNGLQKLTQQTYQDFEIVIVNDGSIDNTSQLVKNFLNINKLDWQLISQENKGEGEARNTGLRYAKGKYILFLDADDYLANNALEKLYNALVNNDVDLSFSSYSYVYKNGSNKLYNHPNKIYSQQELIKLFFRRLANPGIGNTLFKKEIISQYNIRFEKYKLGADNHFFRKLLLYIENAVSIEENLFFYLYNDSSVTNAVYDFDKNLDSIFAVLDTFREIKQTNDEVNKEYLKIFLLTSIRGNAFGYSLSPDYDKKILKERILIYLPKNISIKMFLSNKRTLWLLSLFFFYKKPILFINVYRFLKRIN